MQTAEASLAAFEAAMNDDLATPRAVAALFALVAASEKSFKSSSEQYVTPEVAGEVLKIIRKMDTVLGVLYEIPPAFFSQVLGIQDKAASTANAGPQDAPAEVVALAQKRLELKAAKQYAEADKLRAEILAQGYEVLDRKNGFSLQKSSISE